MVVLRSPLKRKKNGGWGQRQAEGKGGDLAPVEMTSLPAMALNCLWNAAVARIPEPTQCYVT